MRPSVISTATIPAIPEAIITQDYNHAQEFLNRIDAAAVYVNASTRFTDGGEFGFGAEIGISTQKLHARGPMGLKATSFMKRAGETIMKLYIIRHGETPWNAEGAASGTDGYSTE